MQIAREYRTDLHHDLQERICQLILARGLRAGDAMPTETELIRELGVSRGSLREAIKALQMMGVVEIRHGHGTFVGQFSLDLLVDGLAFSLQADLERAARAIRDLLDVREILEAELVARVARSADSGHVEALADLAARMEARAATGESFAEEDRSFHNLLYQPLGNALVIQLLQAFWDVFARLRDEIPSSTADQVGSAANHRRIVTAIAAGDPAAASAAMTLHFTDIHRRLDASSPSSAAAGKEGEPAHQ